MKRLWYLLPPAVGAATGVGLWLALAVVAPNGAAVVVGVAVGLGLCAGMHMLIASHPLRGEPAGQDPWEHGREILHQEHVPHILRYAGRGDETAEIPIRGRRSYRGRRRVGAR